MACTVSNHLLPSAVDAAPQTFDLSEFRPSILKDSRRGVWFNIVASAFTLPLLAFLGIDGVVRSSTSLSERLSVIGVGFGGVVVLGTMCGLAIARNLDYVPERISIDPMGFTYTYPHSKQRRYLWTKTWVLMQVQPSANSEQGSLVEKITLQPPNGGRGGFSCPTARLTPDAAQAILETASRIGLRIKARTLPGGTVYYNIRR